jgi:DNA uptake protein ComE-like DNA-binding protein
MLSLHVAAAGTLKHPQVSVTASGAALALLTHCAGINTNPAAMAATTVAAIIFVKILFFIFK